MYIWSSCPVMNPDPTRRCYGLSPPPSPKEQYRVVLVRKWLQRKQMFSIEKEEATMLNEQNQ